MTKQAKRRMWRIRKRIQRKFIFTNDVKCECGNNLHLERHHIDGNRNHNKQSNIKIVCKECHKRIHYVEKPLTDKEIQNGLVFGITC
jgi:hypothetical protein